MKKENWRQVFQRSQWSNFNLSGTFSVIPLCQHLSQEKHPYAECQGPDFHLCTGFQVWKTSEVHDHRKCLSLSFDQFAVWFFSIEFINQIMYVRAPWLNKIQYGIVMRSCIRSEMLIHLQALPLATLIFLIIARKNITKN